ncbi:MAG: hypothetical protein AVDCRST_MAG04-3168 [uncultured Acetobacteraceae bacterium]|uniref:Uncharacterized protein n=1 Tax=uncultured Acetobacteraceae bacterium TaxID=169975 RepID=A0A6J4J7A0_9PROT|nr:MAG: hypothetical protein AVDCRST_MAG04-3168 [uncultured Acetobacteraceae bacterium]
MADKENDNKRAEGAAQPKPAAAEAPPAPPATKGVGGGAHGIASGHNPGGTSPGGGPGAGLGSIGTGGASTGGGSTGSVKQSGR